MCGICGAVGRIEQRRERVHRMMVALKHRGPDDQGIWDSGSATLANTRLAIIDTSPAGHQPMSIANGSIWVVYNGEVYNFQKEKKMLEQAGYHFNSHTDTEVVLAMYQAYGDDFVKRLRGMFAVAIYDRRLGPGKERMLLIRDQLGIKPLLYSIGEFGIVFASELKAILASGLIEKKINRRALVELLAYGSIPQPLTMIEGVNMLLPGHRLIWEENKSRVDRYWQLDISQASMLRQLPYAELVRLVRNKLEQVIREQLVSDVPLGAFLSGGVDSAALVALMAKASPKPLKTFSVGFGGEGINIDESNRGQTIASYIGTDHTRVELNGEDVKRQLPQIIRALDQPSVDGVNTYLISQVARREVTVALSGLGGDEIFAGYPWFITINNYQLNSRSWLSRLWYRLVSGMAGLLLFDWWLPIGRASRIISKLRGLRSVPDKLMREYEVLGPEGAAKILATPVRDGRINRQEDANELASGSIIQRVSAWILKNYTLNQLLRDADAVSMFHSLELRVPYLDPELVTLVLSLPDITKLNTGRNWSSKSTYATSGAKRILIDAVRDLLPPGIDQQSKQGFGLPFTSWLKGPLREVMDDTLSPTTVSRRNLFRPAIVDRVKKDFLSGRAHWSTVWLLIVIELWSREFID